jgi:hypothetical protein
VVNGMSVFRKEKMTIVMHYACEVKIQQIRKCKTRIYTPSNLQYIYVYKSYYEDKFKIKIKNIRLAEPLHDLNTTNLKSVIW